MDDGKLAATGVAGLAELVKRESDQAVLSGEDLERPCQGRSAGET
jgi:hypothetical protein